MANDPLDTLSGITPGIAAILIRSEDGKTLWHASWKHEEMTLDDYWDNCIKPALVSILFAKDNHG